MSRPRLTLLALIAVASTAPAAEPTAEQLTFFETKIRPVLVTECYDCHAGEKQKGGLRLDSREALRRGGDTGAAVVPGNVEDSLLIASIRHDDPDFKMPEKAPKLDDAIIADFTAWVKMGAPDPRDKPEPASVDGAKAWPEMLAARRGWWSLQPLAKPQPPAIKDAAWPQTEADRFLLAKMEARGLAPAADADPRTIIRRMTFALTGLPPSAEEADAFTRDWPAGTAPSAIENRRARIEKLADRLLASPRFGEHWARHWMDLVRYAESHGSESDPEIPQAWRYRDYLIRAFNADVPCDQLIREHLAGDLLAKPRWNREEQFSESKLGLVSLRLNEHGFQPVDTLDEQVKTVDNQIDVISKAFQGLTVTCARCHDHKFDAISQRDYFALYGVLASSRPAQVTLDAPEHLTRRDGELAALKGAIRDSLANAWLAEAGRLAEKLRGDSLGGVLDEARKDPVNPLHAWARLGGLDGEAFAKGWADVVREWRGKADAARAFNRERFRAGWDFAAGDDAKWFTRGSGLYQPAVRAGEFSIEPEGDRVLDGLRPAGVITDLLSRKHNGTLASPRFKIESDSISVRAIGGGGAWVRLILDNYPLNVNPTFPRAELKPGGPGWVRLDTAYRKGTWAYLEFATADDITRREGSAPKDGRSWFSAERVVFGDKDAPREVAPAAEPLLAGAAPGSAAELAERYASVVADAVKAWRMDAVSEPQRALLDSLIRRGLLPSTLAALPNVAPKVAEYRRIESDVPVPRRAPGVAEGTVTDAALMIRGEHTKPGEIVPRRYLEVLDGTRYGGAQSGRGELAEQIASAKNPLTARVMVNRIWLHLFGRGIVATPDNFGRMGEKPTHPELLDFLAARFAEEGWSFKKMIRYLVTSRAFQTGTEAPPGVAERDAANELLTHARVRRLGAEAIRDSMLAVSGRLEEKQSGPSAADGSAPRRSVYLRVRRNSLNPFLEVFDAPQPYTTLGRRDATNVPAQSLALLNDPFVIELAKQWAAALIRSNPGASPETRVQTMFTAALGREPSAEELSRSAAYVAALAKAHGVDPAQVAASGRVWQDFAQSVFNLKEFIYVR